MRSTDESRKKPLDFTEGFYPLFASLTCVPLNCEFTGYIKDQRYAKLKIRARRFELMEKFYSLWKEKVQHRAEEKVEEIGKEVGFLLS